jgi:hypothetical protein
MTMNPQSDQSESARRQRWTLTICSECGEQAGMGVHGHAPPVEWHWRKVRVAEVAFDEGER